MSDQPLPTFSEKLEEFEKKLGLSDLQSQVDLVSLYLSWTATDLDRNAQEEIKNAMFTISRYALHLSDEMSRHFALAAGMERFYNREISLGALNGRGFTFEEKKAEALAKDTSLQTLSDSIIENEMKANRLKSIIFRLDDLVKKMEFYLRRTS